VYVVCVVEHNSKNGVEQQWYQYSDWLREALDSIAIDIESVRRIMYNPVVIVEAERLDLVTKKGR
jgi:hypothetical protein